MSNVSIAEADAHLSELVECVEAGDAICITRRGKPVAKLTAVQTRRKRVDIAALRALNTAANFLILSLSKDSVHASLPPLCGNFAPSQYNRP